MAVALAWVALALPAAPLALDAMPASEASKTTLSPAVAAAPPAVPPATAGSAAPAGTAASTQAAASTKVAASTQTAASTLTDASAEAPASPALAAAGDPTESPAGGAAAVAPVDAIAERAAQIRALIDGQLDVAIDPRSLFDVPLADESAIAVERARLSVVIDAADAVASADASAAVDPSKAGAARPAASGKAAAKPAAKSAASPAAKGGGLDSVEAELRRELDGLDAAAWRRRLALDRARLAFYSLPPAQRQALLDAHAARQEAAMPRETEEERRARAAEEERLRALEAARVARSEAERLVREEDARLIALGDAIDRVQAGFEASRAELIEHRDVVLGWQRRVREAQAGPAEVADETYDALRVSLRQARDSLANALDALRSKDTAVPSLGEDALRDVPPDVPSESVRKRRVALAAQIVQARAQERALREERARMLEEEVSLLNRERLALLSDLSSDKHAAIVGFTAAGFDQARAEARHLALIVRFRDFAVRHWLASLRTGGARSDTAWDTAAVLVPWTIFAVLFLALRRRTPSLVSTLEQRFEQIDRAQRRTLPSPPTRAVRVLARIHRPIEWIAFLAGTVALLPDGLLNLLEVQLLASVAGWVLGGRLVVGTIDALAAVSGSRSIYEDVGAAELRLRSLRLVGRTIVVLALILIVSDRLVGAGTIYSWVLSVCWFAAVPIFLVLVRWWRGTVFARIDRVRRKSKLEAWVLANREGWKSFLAAMAGAVHLFANGAIKLVRRWMSEFEFARRIHAYLYQREIERLEEDRESVRFEALAPEVLDALHPERPAERWLACPADELVRTLSARVEAGRGGLVAIVGPKGMGKSSLLRMLHERHADSVLVPCRQETTLDEIRAAVGPEQDAPPRLILLDDAHALVRLVIGGMRTFDALGAFARDRCAKTLWVYALDASIAPYLERWRDARPLFDGIHRLAPWSEVEIGALLRDRCRLAEISPIFDDLLERMPIGADELDRYDALRAKQAGYERMLWDHASGNPGIALEVWRSSLARDAAGVVHVRPLQVPDPTPLDGLPDTALFVLRAVLQTMPAAIEDVAEATRLSRTEVLDLLRFGQTRGVFAEEQGRFRISWTWLRPVMRILERRGLMVAR